MSRPSRLFWHDLASHLNMSVSQAQACIDSAAYTEWIAYNNIVQFTVNRVENILAVLCAITANANRQKNSAGYSPEDFLPKYGKTNKTSGKDMEIKLRSILHGNHK